MATRPRTPQEALQRLREGNQRFVSGQSLHGKISEEAFVKLRESQRPFAVILGCSDSRVPPELVFDQSFGDLFVIRLAGNIIAPGVAGSIQYAHQHLIIHRDRLAGIVLSEGVAIRRLLGVLRRALPYRRGGFDVLCVPFCSHGQQLGRSNS